MDHLRTVTLFSISGDNSSLANVRGLSQNGLTIMDLNLCRQTVRYTKIVDFTQGHELYDEMLTNMADWKDDYGNTDY